MKKFLIVLLLILLILISIVIISRPEYSLSEISKIVDKSDEIPDNIYIRKEMVDSAGTNITEIYKKNNIIYEHFYKDDIPEYEDIIWDFNSKKHIQIDYIFKNIYIINIEKNGNENPVTSLFSGFSEVLGETDRKYKYYGKEEIDGRECIKISLTNKNDGITYYYIDIKNENLYKMVEGINNNNIFNALFTTTYTYSYDTVKDEHILKFDINNYPDYRIIEE